MSNGSKLQTFSTIKPDPAWSFSGSGDRAKSNYITHSYHRYPAKFIPQIVDELIKKYAKNNTTVCDPFGGCGTTLVESKIAGLRSVGFDINPVAKLIADVKTTPINPVVLDKNYRELSAAIKKSKAPRPDLHPKLEYWFPKRIQTKLNRIYQPITRIKNPRVRKFFLVGFSNILKNSSIWLQKSIKPTRDLTKNIQDPYLLFERHVLQMMKKNADFLKLLKENKSVRTQTKMNIADARRLPLRSSSVDLIITSPPYVTSYEYADLHQLSLLWLGYTNDLPEFRKRFIGTSQQMAIKEVRGTLANKIVFGLEKRDRSVAREVGNYFSDMELAIGQMYRVLKKHGHACLIIGNTKLKGVNVYNAEVAYDQMIRAGFTKGKVISRRIESRTIAPWRDKVSGKFTHLQNKNRRKAYHTEYLIIMEK